MKLASPLGGIQQAAAPDSREKRYSLFFLAVIVYKR